MKHIFCSLVLFATASSNVFAIDLIPTRTGNYCKDQIMLYFEQYHDIVDVRILKKESFYIGGNNNWSFVDWRIWTNVCDGYFDVKWTRKKSICKMKKKYFSFNKAAPLLINIRGYKGCKDYAPNWTFPNIKLEPKYYADDHIPE